MRASPRGVWSWARDDRGKRRKTIGQRLFQQEDAEESNRRGPLPGQCELAGAARALVFCLILAAAAGPVSGYGSMAVPRTAIPASMWAHRPLADELNRANHANQKRVEELSLSIENDLVVEVDRLKKFVSTKKEEVSEEAETPKRGTTPDWIEALGSGETTPAKEETWIDHPSAAPSPLPRDGSSQGVFKYGHQPEDEFGKSRAVRVTEIAQSKRTTPFAMRRTLSMETVVIADEVVAKKPVDELVAFLDLDKCSIYGQDGNDLTIAVQWMSGGMEKLCGLYSRLVNPQLKPLYQQLKMCVETIPVVLYTMRPQLLRYRSAVRGRTVLMRWKEEWHHSDDQIVIPPFVEEPQQIMETYSGTSPLHPQEQQDLYMSFQRLLAIRKALKDELSLSENPHIVVTAVMKDVQGTAVKLGLPPEKSYLWDDNEVIKGQPHVLTVDPYVAMDRERKETLMDYMEEMNPASSLTQDVVDFMLGAKPDTCSIKLNNVGDREYYVNECSTMARFPIPDLPLRYPTPRFMAMSPEEESAFGLQKHRKTGQGQYQGHLVEYYTAAWRKGDEEKVESKKEWEQRADMVW